MLFLIAAALGMALNLLVPALPPAVTLLDMMAAVTVAVMKTPEAFRLFSRSPMGLTKFSAG